jgi:hypothetical protein
MCSNHRTKIRKTNLNNNKGENTMGSVGSWLRGIPNPADKDPFNKAAREKLNNPSGTPQYNDASSEFGEWSPEKQRAHFDEKVREVETFITNDDHALTFIALHPEWIDSEENGKALTCTAVAMFGQGVWSVQQYEAAYRVACANNLLVLNQAEIAKQKKAALKQRAAAERSRIINLPEEQLENLSLEDFRRLDAEERQRQMQAAGERGGNGF